MWTENWRDCGNRAPQSYFKEYSCSFSTRRQPRVTQANNYELLVNKEGIQIYLFTNTYLNFFRFVELIIIIISCLVHT